MDYAQERQRRRSPRLPGYDYARPGGYFITICTFGREPLLGQVVDDDILLNAFGEVVETCWNHLPDHYPHIQLDAFVVMPNHIHGIVFLVDNDVGQSDQEPNASTDVGAGLRPARPIPTKSEAALPSPSSIKHPSKPTSSRHPLPETVRAFKSFSSRRINESRGSPGAPVWQRSFYEHIIRDEDELYRIRKYIVNNPIRWATDQYYCR
jgi:REP element-mobilizing transposase RayT